MPCVICRLPSCFPIAASLDGRKVVCGTPHKRGVACVCWRACASGALVSRGSQRSLRNRPMPVTRMAGVDCGRGALRLLSSGDSGRAGPGPRISSDGRVVIPRLGVGAVARSSRARMGMWLRGSGGNRCSGPIGTRILSFATCHGVAAACTFSQPRGNWGRLRAI
jgi:hypothetical protein